MRCRRQRGHDSGLPSLVSLAAVLSILFCLVSSACVPDVHSSLLSDPAILQDEAVTAAFAQVQQNLSSLFTSNSSSDGLSFAVVHASGPGLAFTFNHGRLRMNDTSTSPDNSITSDSIFRLASVSKNLAAFSALAIQNTSRAMADADPGAGIHPLSLEAPVRALLPAFTLPERDWLAGGGRDITLSMLGTHTSGLTREGYSAGFNMVAAAGRASAEFIGAEWASVSAADVLAYLGTRGLMFAPGQRAAYSNAGFAVLGAAVASYRGALLGVEETWAEYVQRDIFGPLGMGSSFFGPPAEEVRPRLAVPGVSNWVDLVVDGYNPAGGMWSSAADLAAYLHRVWLAPTPELITPGQRRQALQPRIALPDGAQQVGFGWEIHLIDRPDKTYSVYGKSGDAAGNHAWVDVVPNLGYGIVVLSQESGDDGRARVVPGSVRDAVHEILIPAFEAAISRAMARRFAGNYTVAADGDLIGDEVATTDPSAGQTQSYGLVEVVGGSMFLRSLVVNGTDALEGLDRLSWKANATSGGRFFSVPGVGSGLNPSEAVGGAAALAGGGQGEGVTLWTVIPELDECDWFDFGGYVDQNGWLLSQVALVEKDWGGVELHYPPFDIVLMRSEPV
ncbi:hypothetical protein KVR01_006040 [Diaporthe batatas]|uniref:uncharacterized protein n=1 Tax=Diaporthe batatas TaxID=748121 RepID=UPI001D055416|nr:uncharacterized protein KVR01_006040 [Diaporthe batatas]KAG8164122.1 hypothetical protein KVR01_006040 [Diaporthe batatas]